MRNDVPLELAREKGAFAFNVGIRARTSHYMPDAFTADESLIALYYFSSNSEIVAPVSTNKPALHQEAVRWSRWTVRPFIKEDTVCTHSPRINSTTLSGESAKNIEHLNGEPRK